LKLTFRLIIVILYGFVNIASAHQGDTKDTATVGDVIQSFLGINQPKIGLLMQFDGKITDNEAERKECFELHNMRLLLMGSVAEHFDYLVQGDLKTPYKLLDMKLSYKFSSQLQVDLGQFRTPFGWEYLRDDGRLIFVDRSLAASRIGTFRQRGIQLACSIWEKRLVAVAGIFDGRGIDYNGDEKISLFAGRISAFPLGTKKESDQLKLEVGGSFAISNDPSDLESIDPYNVIGHKRLYSANMRVDFMKTWMGGEFNIMGEDNYKMVEGARLDLVTGVITDIEIAFRFDYYLNFWPGILGPATRCSQYMAGANWYPVKEVKIQMNLGRDFGNRINTGILNVQYGVNLPN